MIRRIIVPHELTQDFRFVKGDEHSSRLVRDVAKNLYNANSLHTINAVLFPLLKIPPRAALTRGHS
jgi:hypothetical protein